MISKWLRTLWVKGSALYNGGATRYRFRVSGFGFEVSGFGFRVCSALDGGGAQGIADAIHAMQASGFML